jgi:hypothetical protein
LTRPGLEPTIYRTPGEHANHYVTDVVVTKLKLYTEYGEIYIICIELCL